MRVRFWQIMAVAVGMLTADKCLAQFPLGQPSYRPPVSPYLNLANRGTNRAIDYYGIVRPQMRFDNRLQQLQADANSQNPLNMASDSPFVGDLPPTGLYPAAFMTQGRYFLTTGNGLPRSGMGSGSRAPGVSGTTSTAGGFNPSMGGPTSNRR